jgi:hypothetical protein
MTTRPVPQILDEYDEYPVHEEDNVPESWIHERIVRYLRDVLAALYPDWDPPDEGHPGQEMRLWRLGPEGYVPAEPEANGRFRSEVPGVEFGWDDEGMLRIYVGGVPQRTYEEAEAERLAEARRRQEAEARAGEELLRREEAEVRRRDAEARAAELERQLAELRARLADEEAR